MRLYILNGHTAVPESDVLKWSQWLETADRHVRLSETNDVTVSTVFLGLDHQHGEGPPLLFETMIFCDGPLNQEQDRCSTWEEAEAMHERMLKRISRMT